jgi:hypothetical protein
MDSQARLGTCLRVVGTLLGSSCASSVLARKTVRELGQVRSCCHEDGTQLREVPSAKVACQRCVAALLCVS